MVVSLCPPSSPVKGVYRFLCLAAPLLEVGGSQANRETLSVNLEGQTAALVIVGQSAKCRIVCHICRQSIFEVGVESTDGHGVASFIKPYLGQLVLLLDACNHFEFHLFSLSFFK